MILGFLGKGGSGKSSVSSQMSLFLRTQNYAVLAIDADHNMDLSYNLSGGEVPVFPYLGGSLTKLKETVGITPEQAYTEVFTTAHGLGVLTPAADFITTHSVELPNGIRLMAAGPQTDTVLYGKACSHSLTTSLKILLPLLELSDAEMVVVDEKAGADGVTTGIVTGLDVGVIVCEPALHSIKTAKQIADLMDFYHTPYIFVGNKITSTEDVAFIEETLGTSLITYFTESSVVKRTPSELDGAWQAPLQTILTVTREKNKHNRLERTIQKFQRNQEFATA